MSLVENIRFLCKKVNTSVPKLEKELSFGNGAIYNWDKNSPSIDKLQKVADYFNVSIDYLIGKSSALEFFNKMINEFRYTVNEILEEKKLSINELSVKLGIESTVLIKVFEDDHGLTYEEFKSMINTIIANERNENTNEIIQHYFFDFAGFHSKIFNYENNISAQNHIELSALSPKEERDIARDLERMLSNLESQEAMSFYDGEPLDEESKELLRISLENSMRLAKQMSKKKFTPKKYREE